MDLFQEFKVMQEFKTDREFIEYIEKMINRVTSKFSSMEVFEDICSMIAYGYSERLAGIKLKIIDIKKLESKYTPEELNKMAIVTMAIGFAGMKFKKDILGKITYDIGRFHKGFGQVMTPDHISELMASLNFTKEGLEKQIEENGYVLINEPCVGCGSIGLGVARTIENLGISLNKVIYLAKDISFEVLKKAYIQLIPTKMNLILIHGNILLDGTEYDGSQTILTNIRDFNADKFFGISKEEKKMEENEIIINKI